ncbi:MarR family winged helix-turn-helix transcriptional regulator [Roseixanthobacter pseudopolyaromaticivorans]|uniref:MarR family winged helix-turn-helix transcriptional regulator n=1 Tax=Xanthobacteraceae TaxID=335928 RepID=UPI00372997B1
MTETPLGFLLVDAARLYRASIDRAFEQTGLGLTAGEARTLVYANLHPGLRQTALAVRMNVEPMTLVGFLDKLEAQGLISRTPDPNDRRAKTVNLTPAADAILSSVLAAAAGVRMSALEGLSESEKDTFRKALEQIRTNLCLSAKDDAQ